jgi:alkaline phosphatase D
MDRFHFEQLLSKRFQRRGFLLGAGALTGLAISSQWSQRVVAAPKFSGYPFSLGIASGDPFPKSVVLWTRLAPEPFSSDGGMPQQNVPVQWQVSTNESMSHIVRSGTAIATQNWLILYILKYEGWSLTVGIGINSK